MELIGKNAYRRRFKEILEECDLNLTVEPLSGRDLAISTQGNDTGSVFWPIVQDENLFWLMASVQDLKSEKALRLTRKNPKHLAWFNRNMFTSLPVQETVDICNEDRLRDIIRNAYAQSPTGRRVIDLQAGERGKRLMVAHQLQTYQKEWRRRLSLSDKECCNRWKEQH